MIQNINWYPGHMKKTRELIEDNMKMVDIVIEVLDGRIPSSSRNPIIEDLIKGKKQIVILNKSDLSDSKVNVLWKDYFTSDGAKVVEANCMLGHGMKDLFNILEKEQRKLNLEKKRNKPLRMMIVGVPNVGKSSLINRMTGKKSAQTGDRPGVTKGKQWINLKNGMQLLDTPGILWPKFEDPSVGLNLAFCGSIKDEILDVAELSLELIKALEPQYGERIIERYQIETLGETSLETMEFIGKKRGFIRKGNMIDYERTARTILDEFRGGKIGRITLEKPKSIILKPKQAPLEAAERV